VSLPRRWAILGLYVAAVYASLPFGPRVGLALLRMSSGGWLLGPGLPLLALTGAAVVLVRLTQRRASWWAYAVLVAAALGYTLAFSWLRAQRLERTHLVEYGIVAWLAWRAIEPELPGRFAAYAAAAVLTALIGWGDELLQRVVPGRYYDLRDVAMNALGGVLALLVLAAVRASEARHKAAAFPENAEIATGPASP
jgi:VanZ like protein